MADNIILSSVCFFSSHSLENAGNTIQARFPRVVDYDKYNLYIIYTYYNKCYRLYYTALLRLLLQAIYCVIICSFRICRHAN